MAFPWAARHGYYKMPRNLHTSLFLSLVLWTVGWLNRR